MAGYKETPRQKMIGMMYLVLTALLALNVSKEILNAFVVVNEGLVQTNEILEGKNGLLMNDFDQQLSINAEKVKPYHDKAVAVKQKSDELIDYIRDVQRKVVAYTEYGDQKLTEAEYKNHEKEYVKESILKIPLESIKKKDSYDKPMEILIPDDEPPIKKGEGYEIKKRIIEYKNFIHNLDPSFKDIELGLDVEDKPNPHVKTHAKMPWEYNTFYHTVLAADVVLFNKLVAEVQNTQADVINKLFANITKKDFKFDTIAAKVLPKSTYVIRGDEYQSQIFVAAFSTTEQPVVYIKSGVDSLRVEDTASATRFNGVDGVVNYKIPASGLGEQKYAGVIVLTGPTGDKKFYPFTNQNYNVGSPSATIAPTKMNAMYFGVNNPMDISVSGFPSSAVSASMTNGTLSRSGDGWIAKPSSSNGDAIVSVSVRDGEGNTRSMGKMKFRLFPIPDPVAKIAGLQGGPIRAEVIRNAPGIAAVYENTLFDFKASVVKFSMLIRTPTGYQEVENRGERFNATIKGELSRVRRGQKLIFENIFVRKDDGRNSKIGDIVFTVQ